MTTKTLQTMSQKIVTKLVTSMNVLQAWLLTRLNPVGKRSAMTIVNLIKLIAIIFSFQSIKKEQVCIWSLVTTKTRKNSRTSKQSSIPLDTTFWEASQLT